MSSPISIQLPSQKPSLQLVFEKTNDRWSHRWMIATEADQIVWLESVEGTADQVWPPSPPLQEVSQHRLPHGDAVLGVGMAGRSHWSASHSVELASEPLPGSIVGPTHCFRTELACLQKQVIPTATSAESPESAKLNKLGSRYRIASNVTIDSANTQTVKLSAGGQHLILDAITNDEYTSIFELADRDLTIHAAQVSESPVHPTRWGFEVKTGNG